MNRPVYSVIDQAIAEVAKAKEKHASPHLSKPSNESAPAESMQPPLQQSSGEAAKTSELLLTETDLLLVRKPPEDSSSDNATGGRKGDEHSNRIKDKREATYGLAYTTKDNAKSLKAPAAEARVTGSSVEFDSEEDALIEQERSGTPNTACATTKPHDDSHDNWDDTDITLHTSEDDSCLTAVEYPESSDNEKNTSATKTSTEKITLTTGYQVQQGETTSL